MLIMFEVEAACVVDRRAEHTRSPADVEQAPAAQSDGRDAEWYGILRAEIVTGANPFQDSELAGIQPGRPGPEPGTYGLKERG